MEFVPISRANRQAISNPSCNSTELNFRLTYRNNRDNIFLSVATQESWQFVNKTFVIRLKGRVRPAFFHFALVWNTQTHK